MCHVAPHRACCAKERHALSPESPRAFKPLEVTVDQQTMTTICHFHNTSPLSVCERRTNGGGAARGMKEAASCPSSTEKKNNNTNTKEWSRLHGHRLRQHRREGGGRVATALHATASGDKDDSTEATEAVATASSGSGRRNLLAGCASLAAGLSIDVEGEGSPCTIFFGRDDGVGVVGLATPTLSLSPPAAQAADVASFVSLDALVAQVRAATSELTLIREALSTSAALGTEPPLKELKKRLTSGALADLPEAAVRLDRFIDNAPLEEWEDAVWSSVAEETRGSREIQNVTGKRLPGVERTNDFLCLVFSCFNGERVECGPLQKKRGARSLRTKPPPPIFTTAFPYAHSRVMVLLLSQRIISCYCNS